MSQSTPRIEPHSAGGSSKEQGYSVMKPSSQVEKPLSLRVHRTCAMATSAPWDGSEAFQTQGRSHKAGDSSATGRLLKVKFILPAS